MQYEATSDGCLFYIAIKVQPAGKIFEKKSKIKMELDVLYTVREAENIAEGTVIVIDVLRASTTIVTALANGCPAVYVEESVETALKRAEGRDDLLLCGERHGRKIKGFDLGNSPLEYTAE